MIFLTLPELLHVAERTLGTDFAVRDYGLLEAALARPQATAFGKDAYPDLDTKAAALLHSLARHHALIDGNKRLGLAAVIAFYGLNGRRLTLTNEEAYHLVMKVAAGQLDTVDEITATLQPATQPRLQIAEYVQPGVGLAVSPDLYKSVASACMRPGNTPSWQQVRVRYITIWYAPSEPLPIPGPF